MLTGDLVWVYAPRGARPSAVMNVLQRLSAQFGPLCVVITTDDPQRWHAFKQCLTTKHQYAILPIPSEKHSEILRFLQHFKPAVCLWVLGALRPNLIDAAADFGITMLLVDAERDALWRHNMRFLPDLTKEALARFDHAFFADQPNQEGVELAGLSLSHMSCLGPLQEIFETPEIDDENVDEWRSALDGRPLWLATNVTPDSHVRILETHAKLLRSVHRLVLVIVDHEAPSLWADKVRDAGFRSVVVENIPRAKESVQVMVETDPAQLYKVWTHIAPVTFIGDADGGRLELRNPHPIALAGSAILYCTKEDRFKSAFQSLDACAAARRAETSKELVSALFNALAPDQAALMAERAWSHVSAGADVTDAVVDMMYNAMLEKL